VSISNSISKDGRDAPAGWSRIALRSIRAAAGRRMVRINRVITRGGAAKVLAKPLHR
jgi:hypothetical protein